MRNEGGRPVRITLCPLRRLVEHPGQIEVGIETVLLRRLDQAEDHGAAPGAVGGVCKQEVLPRDHKRLDAVNGTEWDRGRFRVPFCQCAGMLILFKARER